MNIFTQHSIELACQKDYLDRLFSVYPLRPDSIRVIDPTVWNSIEHCYNKGDNVELFKSLLDLELFPVKDSYVPFFKRDKTAIERNPNTVNRICGRVRELGLDKLYETCTQPKETNRQIGPLFKNWLNKGTLGVFPVGLDEFTASNANAILSGSDKELKEFAECHLGYKRNKGLDFLGRFNGKYIIGEAKFITDEGGHQNDQFEDAVSTIKSNVNKDVISIGILDGVLYIPGRKKMYKAITEQDLPIMSALLLRNFLYSI